MRPRPRWICDCDCDCDCNDPAIVSSSCWHNRAGSSMPGANLPCRRWAAGGAAHELRQLASLHSLHVASTSRGFAAIFLQLSRLPMLEHSGSTAMGECIYEPLQAVLSATNRPASNRDKQPPTPLPALHRCRCCRCRRRCRCPARRWPPPASAARRSARQSIQQAPLQCLLQCTVHPCAACAGTGVQPARWGERMGSQG